MSRLVEVAQVLGEGWIDAPEDGQGSEHTVWRFSAIALDILSLPVHPGGDCPSSVSGEIKQS